MKKNKNSELACRIEFNMDEYVLKSWKRRLVVLKVVMTTIEFSLKFHLEQHIRILHYYRSKK